MHEPDALLSRAQALGESFAQASPTAVGLVKEAMAHALGGDLPAMLDREANGQALAAGTEHHKQAVLRFLGKEAPLFRWPARH